jgi:hypothetical protein
MECLFFMFEINVPTQKVWGIYYVAKTQLERW